MGIIHTADYNGSRYHLLDTDGTKWWYESELEAQSLGGRLVTINSAAENQWVLNTFFPVAQDYAYWYGLPDQNQISLWLGLNDVSSEGSFKWSSGQAVNYTNWQPGEPAGSAPDEDFVGMLGNGKWHDIIGDTRFIDLPFAVVEVKLNTPPKISITDIQTTEGNLGIKNFTFQVKLDKASNQPVRVNYNTANGTGRGNVDYVATSGVLTFSAGQRVKNVTVPVIGDKVVESNETFFVNLSNARNATINDNQGKGTISNDDVAPLPNIVIKDVSVSEGNLGIKNFNFQVKLNRASTKPVRVNYRTANNSAIGNVDYITGQGVVNFSPGQTVKNISVAVIGDTLRENNEAFFVNLSGAQNARISDSQGKGTIINDDRARLIASSTSFSQELAPSIFDFQSDFWKSGTDFSLSSVL